MKTIEELRRALEGGATHMLDRTVAGRILTIGEMKDELADLEAIRDVALPEAQIRDLKRRMDGTTRVTGTNADYPELRDLAA